MSVHVAATPLALLDASSNEARPSFAIISDQYTASSSVLPQVRMVPHTVRMTFA